MDWTAIADQLAKGQKAYEFFREGAELASQLASFERANKELQARYDAFPTQIAQAQVDLQTVKEQVAQTLAEGVKAAANQAADFESAHDKRVASAQEELGVWETKCLAQSQAFDAEYAHYQDVIKGLKSQVDQLTGQIGSLEQIKKNLKSQLQGVA